MTGPPSLLAGVDAVRRAATTSRQLTEAAIQRADTQDELGVFAARYDESALVVADLADAGVSAGRPLGPLHGIPKAWPGGSSSRGAVGVAASGADVAAPREPAATVA